MKALIMTAEGFEDSELLVPYYRLLEEGLTVDIASMSKGWIVGKHGYEIGVTHTLDEVKSEEYDLLILPGGKAPAKVRKELRALTIAENFFKAGKPVAAICHGPQILISAGLLKGRRVTGYSGISDEIREAGANYLDEEVVVDGLLVTSRQPSDLPAFMRETMNLLRMTMMPDAGCQVACCV